MKQVTISLLPFEAQILIDALKVLEIISAGTKKKTVKGLSKELTNKINLQLNYLIQWKEEIAQKQQQEKRWEC